MNALQHVSRVRKGGSKRDPERVFRSRSNQDIDPLIQAKYMVGFT